MSWGLVCVRFWWERRPRRRKGAWHHAAAVTDTHKPLRTKRGVSHAKKNHHIPGALMPRTRIHLPRTSPWADVNTLSANERRSQLTKCRQCCTPSTTISSSLQTSVTHGPAVPQGSVFPCSSQYRIINDPKAARLAAHASVFAASTSAVRPPGMRTLPIGRLFVYVRLSHVVGLTYEWSRIFVQPIWLHRPIRYDRARPSRLASM